MAKDGDQEQMLREKIKSMVFKISNFSEELLSELSKLNDWPEKVKTMQKNWIGKSYGCEIDFKINGSQKINSINAILQDLTLYSVSLFWLYQLITQFQNIMKMTYHFKNLKSVQKQVRLKSR